MGIVQGSVSVHLVCQVGGIGHKAVHKGDELSSSNSSQKWSA